MLTKKLPKVGGSLTIGGPSNLLPDYPENIFTSKHFNKTIPIIIGTTQTDGSYPMTSINHIFFLSPIEMKSHFSCNFTVAYDFLASTNRLNDKKFLQNDLIDTVDQFMGKS